MPAAEIIAKYHDLWHVERSFRMSKTDLDARPMFHRTRDAIEAHLTIVFTALAVAHAIQTHRTGHRQRLKQLRPLRSATIVINGATQTFPPEIPEAQRKILADLGSKGLLSEMSKLSRPAPGGRAVVREDSAVVTCCAHLRRGGIIVDVRRGCPRKDLGAFEPVSQHGGGGLPREPWIGASSPCVRLPTLPALPTTDAFTVGYDRREHPPWTSFTRVARDWTFPRRTLKSASGSTAPAGARPVKQ